MQRLLQAQTDSYMNSPRTCPSRGSNDLVLMGKKPDNHSVSDGSLIAKHTGRNRAGAERRLAHPASPRTTIFNSMS